MEYIFRPSVAGRNLFPVMTEKEYRGEGMTPLLESVLGKKDYARYRVAQDHFCGGKTRGSVTVYLGPAEASEIDPEAYYTIGTIELSLT